MTQEPKICLTFDVEEFDVLSEFGGQIAPELLYEPSRKGLDELLGLFDREQIAVTLFCTANYVAACREQIARAKAAGHEIASHGLKHTRLDPEDIALSKEKIEALTGSKLRGFRSPRFAAIDPDLLEQAGYEYDSSIHPIWLPGRYNYLKYPPTPFLRGNLREIPASVTPGLRFPLFWLSFKNIPFALYAAMCRYTLRRHGFLNLVFHPWEFSDLSQMALPTYVKRIHGRELTDRLDRLIQSLRPYGSFTTLGDMG